MNQPRASLFRLGMAGLLAAAGSLAIPASRGHAEDPAGAYRAEIHRRLDSDEGLSAEERRSWTAALDEGFVGAFRNVPSDEANVLDRVDTIFHVVIEGIFADLGPADVVPAARAAFEALSLGAPADAAGGIALYGLSDYARDKKLRLDPRQIAAWARGSDEAKRAGVPAYVADDFIAEAISLSWTLDDYARMNDALIRAVRAGFEPETAGRYLLISAERGDQGIGSIVSGMFPYLDKIKREQQGKGEKPESRTGGSGQSGGGWQWRDGPEVVRQESSPGVSPQGWGQGWGVQPGLPAGFVAAPRQGPSKQQRPRQPAQQARSQAPAERSAAPRGVMAQPGDPRGEVGRGSLQVELESWIGTPYQWGGTRKTFGVDCSGFTQGSFGAVGVRLPRVSGDQARIGLGLPASGSGNLTMGDMVFFDTSGRAAPSKVTHVGVYLGSGRMIHASSSKGVMEADFERRYYRSKYLFGRRVTNVR